MKVGAAKLLCVEAMENFNKKNKGMLHLAFLSLRAVLFQHKRSLLTFDWTSDC